MKTNEIDAAASSSPVSMQDNAEGVESLKSCPFCGGPAEHYSRSNKGEPAVGWLQHEVDHWAGCSSDEGCGAHTCMHESEAEAVAAWNTRVSSPVPSVDVGGDGNRLPRCVAGAAAAVWQPISSAPKDETLVWLFEPHDAGGFMFAGLFDARRQAWINNLDQQEQKPTRWMPLPNEPAPTDEERGADDDALTLTVSIKGGQSPGSPYAWSAIRTVPGTSIVDGGVMLLAETGECIGMVKVLMPRDGIVQNDVARALQTAGNPAKLQRFIRAARRGEEEANERAEIAEAALAALTASPAGDDPKALDAAARSSSTEAVEQEVERLRYILFLFREFWFQNVTQTKIGSGHHHPMWQTVAEALGSMNQRTGTTPEEWQFITGHNKPFPAPSLPGKEVEK